MAATQGAIQRHLERLRHRRHGGGRRLVQPVPHRLAGERRAILIVIPTKNKAELLRTAVESIERTAAGTDYRLVLVDHESTSRRARLFRRLRHGTRSCPMRGRSTTPA